MLFEDAFKHGIEMMAQLSKQLISEGKYEELERATEDKVYRLEKMVEYKIISAEKAKQFMTIYMEEIGQEEQKIECL